MVESETQKTHSQWRAVNKIKRHRGCKYHSIDSTTFVTPESLLTTIVFLVQARSFCSYHYPKDWAKLARCSYDEPSDPYTEVILQQNLKGERCAIDRYKEIADFTAEKDYATHAMAVKILNDELEHENDIESWLTDLDRLKEEFKKIKM